MLSVSRPRLSGRITWPGCAPLQLADDAPLTSTGFWRSTGSSFPYKRQTDLERREEMLMERQSRDLHSFDG
jgi:hypothetical protein